MPLSDCLARIARRDREVQGWSYLDRTAQGGQGPLAGLALAVKDVIDVSAMPTTHGSPIFAGHVAPEDAEAVARLRAAGAVVLGKAVTAEFAAYHPGPTANPRNLAHTPGGSSSGSAALVADGQADFALGTQTAGSIVRPASFCGTLGFKPSFGRYPLGGVLTTAPSLDTLGLFARNLDIMVAADAVLSGDDAAPAPLERLAVGICRGPAWPQASAAMQCAVFAFADRLREAGQIVIERDLSPLFEPLIPAQALIHRRELAVALGHIRMRWPDQISGAFAAMVDQGARESDAEYCAARTLQRICKDALAGLFARVDLLLAPGAPCAAPRGLASTGDPVFQRIWTALGVPCLGFPGAWRNDGLPLGLQIIGPPGSDRQFLSNARAIVAHAELREN